MINTAFTTRSLPIVNRFFKFFQRSYFFNIFRKSVPKKYVVLSISNYYFQMLQKFVYVSFVFK